IDESAGCPPLRVTLAGRDVSRAAAISQRVVQPMVRATVGDCVLSSIDIYFDVKVAGGVLVRRYYLGPRAYTSAIAPDCQLTARPALDLVFETGAYVSAGRNGHA